MVAPLADTYERCPSRMSIIAVEGTRSGESVVDWNCVCPRVPARFVSVFDDKVDPEMPAMVPLLSARIEKLNANE